MQLLLHTCAVCVWKLKSFHATSIALQLCVCAIGNFRSHGAFDAILLCNSGKLINLLTHKAWNGMKCNFHQIYCYCCAFECASKWQSGSQAVKQSKWHANGNGMAIALMASSVSLYRHYNADREQRACGYEEGKGANSCWSIAKSIAIINMSKYTNTLTHRHTRGQWSGLSRLGDIIATITSIVILSTQNGRRSLTFKCSRHCSQLTVRAEPHPSNAESSELNELSAAGSGQRAAEVDRLKSQRENNKATKQQKCLGKAMQNICHGVKFLAYT